MRTVSITVFVAAFASLCTPALADEHRQLGAHVHGHGRLNIAIEGRKVSMELEVPGADIVGFEHEPSTPDQRAAIPEARAKLANAMALFAPAPGAGCELEHVKVTIETGDGEEHEHEHGQEAEDHHHSEFHAEYALECRSPSRLNSMSFDYFNVFPDAQQLDVSVIAPKGQSSFAVTREKPSLDLAGIM